MRVSLPYGSTHVGAVLPDDARVLLPHVAEPLREPVAALAAALASPLGAPPLADLPRGRSSACIVVSDHTRPAVGRHVLPAVCDLLSAGGVGRIEIVVATGTHRASTPAEVLEIVGESVARRYPVRSHDCVRGAHDLVGRTPSGTPVWIDQGYVRSELRIVVGVVEPHLMAGYSGGAKNICPGLARLDTVQGVHRASMARGRVGPGIVEGNPFRAEVREAARLADASFSIQICATRAAVPAFVSAGDLDATVSAACDFAAAHARVSAAAEHDVVLATAGGAPLDRTLYQAAKGWAAGAGVVRPGGDLVLVAELSEGIGADEFEALLGRVMSAQAAGSGGTGAWMVQHIEQLRARARLHLVSSLDAGRVRALGFAPHASVDEALARILPPKGEHRLLVLPEGPYCVAAVGDRLLTLEGAVSA